MINISYNHSLIEKETETHLTIINTCHSKKYIKLFMIKNLKSITYQKIVLYPKNICV